jgi:hypothetical protein
LAKLINEDLMQEAKDLGELSAILKMEKEKIEEDKRNLNLDKLEFKEKEELLLNEIKELTEKNKNLEQKSQKNSLVLKQLKQYKIEKAKIWAKVTLHIMIGMILILKKYQKIHIILHLINNH